MFDTAATSRFSLYAYEVMRYSEPVAVVLAYDDYLKLRGECRRCVVDLRKIAQKAKE